VNKNDISIFGFPASSNRTPMVEVIVAADLMKGFLADKAQACLFSPELAVVCSAIFGRLFAFRFLPDSIGNAGDWSANIAAY
jgi:hypothetical protein